jgi:hypothetical protein
MDRTDRTFLPQLPAALEARAQQALGYERTRWAGIRERADSWPKVTPIERRPDGTHRALISQLDSGARVYGLWDEDGNPFAVDLDMGAEGISATLSSLSGTYQGVGWDLTGEQLQALLAGGYESMLTFAYDLACFWWDYGGAMPDPSNPYPVVACPCLNECRTTDAIPIITGVCYQCGDVCLVCEFNPSRAEQPAFYLPEACDALDADTVELVLMHETRLDLLRRLIADERTRTSRDQTLRTWMVRTFAKDEREGERHPRAS